MRVIEGARPDELWPALVHEAKAALSLSVVVLARYEALEGIVYASTDDVLYPIGKAWPKGDDAPQPERRKTTVTSITPLAEVSCLDPVSVNIRADGQVWGILRGLSAVADPLRHGVQRRLGRFAEFAAAVISNAIAHDELQRLAVEQSALRRVAQLVAEESPPEVIFDAVAREASLVMGLARVAVYRYNDDRSVTVMGTTPHPSFGPVGTRGQLDGPSALTWILDTGTAHRIDDLSGLPGTFATLHRAGGITGSAGAPIMVDGRLWGALVALATAPELFPIGIETRIANFTELLSTCIANVQARDRLRAMALEQGALRRVATLVAERAEPNEIFATVAQEASRVLDVSRVGIYRYNADGSVTVTGSTDQPGPRPVGETWPPDGPSVVATILDTGQAFRIDDFSTLSGPKESNRSAMCGSVVGAPITVEGELWGAILAMSAAGNALPPDSEVGLASFTHVVSCAISNMQARDDLIASRARIITAAHEARRRIERDLHDGIQQRLLSLGLSLQALNRAVPTHHHDIRSGLIQVSRELETLLADVRDIARGLHPSLLTRYGLGPTLRALARRSPIPVTLDIRIGPRPSEAIEIAIYYVVSEALSNAAKHSGAAEVRIGVVADEELVTAVVSDSGVGGAEFRPGSGLMGMLDRVEALGGRITLSSPRGEGTQILVELPSDNP
jgi:signal transduction histidine kinase